MPSRHPARSEFLNCHPARGEAESQDPKQATGIRGNWPQKYTVGCPLRGPLVRAVTLLPESVNYSIPTAVLSKTNWSRPTRRKLTA